MLTVIHVRDPNSSITANINTCPNIKGNNDDNDGSES